MSWEHLKINIKEQGGSQSLTGVTWNCRGSHWLQMGGEKGILVSYIPAMNLEFIKKHPSIHPYLIRFLWRMLGLADHQNRTNSLPFLP